MPRFEVTWKDGAKETICGENPQVAFFGAGYKNDHLDFVESIRNLPAIRVIGEDGLFDISGITQSEMDAFERLWLAIENQFREEVRDSAMTAALVAWKQALRNPNCT